MRGSAAKASIPGRDSDGDKSAKLGTGHLSSPGRFRTGELGTGELAGELAGELPVKFDCLRGDVSSGRESTGVVGELAAKSVCVEPECWCSRITWDPSIRI